MSWLYGAFPITSHIVNHRKHANWTKQSLAWVYSPTQLLVQLTLLHLEQDHTERAIAFGLDECAVPGIPNAQTEQLGHPR